MERRFQNIGLQGIENERDGEKIEARGGASFSQRLKTGKDGSQGGSFEKERERETERRRKGGRKQDHSLETNSEEGSQLKKGTETNGRTNRDEGK